MKVRWFVGLASGLMAAALFVAACESATEEPLAEDTTIGQNDVVADVGVAPEDVYTPGPDLAPLDTGGGGQDLIADLAEDTGSVGGPDVAADVPVVPVVSGCVTCHTDKERLMALAPEEPHHGEEGGGG